MFSNWLTSASSAVSSMGLSTATPDVILEIGPMPFTRYAAHSPILAAHSGYMRSLFRPDERVPDCPIYIPNVTAEHFAPLLTYMYTGFLDLTIENIFGVLLATHVLHMPRAVEICRSFLTRIQSDGYMNGSFLPSPSLHTSKPIEKSRPNSSLGDPVKIIRPIASKATTNGLAFIAPPMAKTLLPSHDTPFKSLNLSATSTSYDNPNEINVDKLSNEDFEVRKSPIASTSSQVQTLNDINKTDHESKSVKNSVKLRKRSHSKSKSSQSPTFEIAQMEAAPVIVDDSSESDKIVIDVASCDGPVRFQRVLNDAYGRYPMKNATLSTSTKHIERKHAHMANSFHLQMARNISERQSIDTSGVDSENSEEIIVENDNKVAKCTKDDRIKHKINNFMTTGNNTKSDEVYICVYCKHTFKSQYCYQKHAKRHLNPLSIDGDLIVDSVDSDKDEKSEKSLVVPTGNNVNLTTTAATALSSSSSSSTTSSSSSSIAADRKSVMVKREVRPLDMNVQYYPCKTCGSKFPSYYFVHKHRKLCHANEEN